MIKMTRVYGDMYAPREYCTFTNPVTSGGTEELWFEIAWKTRRYTY